MNYDNGLKSITDGLNSNLDYYDPIIECEYTGFEEDLHKYCKESFEFYKNREKLEIFLESLISIVDNICKLHEYFYYYEAFFRPIELITYYFGKIASYEIMEDEVYEKVVKLINRHDDELIDEYLKKFIAGEKIPHTDTHYINFKDFNRITKVFKK